MSIYLTALIKSKPNYSSEMKAVLLELVTGSRTEDACLQYNLHQDASDENLFIFHEEWGNKEGLEKHNTSPHVLKFIAATKELIDGSVVIYQTKKLI